MTSRDIIFNIWSQLWETPAGYDMVAPTANSYFTYLQKRSEILRKHLTKKLRKNIKSINESVTYCMWVTLGPSLVEGYGILLGLGTNHPLLTELKKLEDKVQEPEAWDEDWRPLISLARLLEIRRTPFIEALDGLRQDITKFSPRDIVEPNLRHSYVLGILSHKHPWDSPECTSAASQIIEQAASKRDPNSLTPQANILASMGKGLTPKEAVFRMQQQQLANKWIRQQADYLSKTRTELGVELNE